MKKPQVSANEQARFQDIGSNDGTEVAVIAVEALGCPGTPTQAAATTPVHTRTALADGMLQRVVHVETASEVYLKFGAVTVVASAADYHLHLRGGDHRTIYVGPHTHVSALAVGVAGVVSIWRVDGV